MPYRVAAGLLAHLLPLEAGTSPETLRGHTFKAGEQLRDAATVPPASGASAITITDNKRSRVETKIGRFKQVIGGGLRFHTDARHDTEIAVSIHLRNHMLDFGRPSSVRIA
jgi:hypothetical protein